MQRTFLLPLAALLLAVPGLRAANAIATPPEEQLTYHTDARFGRVLFIRNEAAQLTASDAFWRAPLPPSPSGPILNTADLAQPEWAGAVATAREFLRWHAGEFLDDSRSRGRQSAPFPSPEDQRRLTSAATANAISPDTDLVPLRAERDALGMTHVRFTQTYRGLPVFGADATVHLAADGRVSSAGARLVPDIQVDVQPTLTREQAVLVAVALWQEQFQRTETPEATSTNLCLLAPGLLQNDGNTATHLVWEVKLTHECKECQKPLSREDYYIDAYSGELREQLTRIRQLNRLIYDCSARPGSDSCYYDYPVRFNGVRYYFGRSEDSPVRGPNPRYFPEISTDTDDVFDLFAAVTDYCLARFGRNGANGQGGTGDGVNAPVSESRGFVYVGFLSNWTNSCPGTAG